MVAVLRCSLLAVVMGNQVRMRAPDGLTLSSLRLTLKWPMSSILTQQEKRRTQKQEPDHRPRGTASINYGRKKPRSRSGSRQRSRSRSMSGGGPQNGSFSIYVRTMLKYIIIG